MENYKIQNRLGDGTYGSVFKAIHVKTGDVVAIKKFKKKYPSWDECMQLREIKSLRKLVHPNIIKLKEVLKVQDELNLVFEYLDQNVFQVYRDYKAKGDRMSENTIRSMIKQILEGLAYMHKHGYFHRDLKPENLLMHGETVKICDFGLAREVRSRPPYTDYVATRWYRAPEILLKQPNYNSPVDIFAVGCIMAELYMLDPLFDGKSEIDQLLKICTILGTPTPQIWPDVTKLAATAGISLPHCQPQQLDKIITGCSVDGIQVITEMLRYDPSKRMSASQLLSLPYFNVVHSAPQQIIPNIQFKNAPRKEEDRINFGKIADFKLGDSRANFYDGPTNHIQKDDKFRDSTYNFLEFLEKKLNEDDKKPDKFKESGTKDKFFINKPISKQPDDAIEKMLEKDTDDLINKRNNPFKLLKYNDPIMNGQSNSLHGSPLHSDPPIRQKPLSVIHNNHYNPTPSYQLNYMPTQGRLQRPDPNVYQNSTLQPVIPSGKPPYHPSRHNYGRLGEGILSNNRVNKFDEFGFAKQAPSKYGNY